MNAYLPANQGFDHYFGILHNLDSYEVVHFEDEGGIPLLRNGEVVRPQYRSRAIWQDCTRKKPSPGSKSELPQVAGQQSSEPFFLYLPHTMLHEPLGVSPRVRR